MVVWGMRIVQDAFCQALIEALGAPLISTSANISGQPSPSTFEEVSQEIISAVDHVVPLRQNEARTQASKIIRLSRNNEIEVLRA